MPDTRSSQRISGSARSLVTWLRAHRQLVAFCLLVGIYYLWTIRSSRLIGGVSPYPGYYNMLADAFLHGHLHLLVEPPRELLALADPYDPVQNARLRLWDLSLYHDHYYLYWGPAPALVLFAPMQLIGAQISQATAVFVFAFVGFCFSVAVMRELVARFAPGAPRWMIGAATVGLAFGNALPFVLRRPDVYEVALCAGFCFCFIAMYLAITAIRGDGVSIRRLGGAGVFIGLAMASRPTMLFGAIALVCLAIWLMRREDDKAQGRRILAAAAAPIGVFGALLLAYNAARFGNPLEFGQSYQLAGFEVSTKKPNQISYLPPGSWYYLFSPPELTWRFPYLRLPAHPGSYPFTPPRGYDGLEGVSGLLVSVPFTLFAFAGLAVTRGRLRTVIAALCALALTIMLFTSFALYGATQRYEIDFATFLLIAATLAWLVWADAVGPRARKALMWGGTVLIGWGVIFGVTTGLTGYYDSLRLGSPGTYDRLQRLTSFVPAIGSKLEGKPLVLNAALDYGQLVDSDPGNGVGTLSILLPNAGTTDLTVASGSDRTYGLALAGDAIPGTPLVDQISVRMPQTGAIHVIKGGSIPPTIVPVKLKRGLNHILISATGRATSQISLVGVRLVPAAISDP
jgi:hypothetical protein